MWHVLITLLIGLIVLAITYSKARHIKHAQAALAANEERYRTVIETMEEGVVILCPELSVISSNPAAVRILGAEPGDFLAHLFQGGEHDVVQNVVREDGTSVSYRPADVKEALRRGATYRDRIFGLRGVDGSERWISLNLKPLCGGEGNEPSAYLITFSDITTLKEQEATIRQLAYVDDLTGLPNRRCFRECLEQSVAHASADGTSLAVFFMDMDRFKEVNDSRGHEVGDELLIAIADRLKPLVGADATLARYGGDEFLLLLPNVSGIDQVRSVAEAILTSLETPFHLREDYAPRLSTSIGIAVYPEDGTTAKELLEKADLGMYKAKSAGRSQYQLAGVDQPAS